MTASLDRLRQLLATGPDSPTLRFALGSALLETEPAQAADHLVQALALDPGYSAAWKLLGRARLALGDPDAARAAWEQGIEAARQRGDQQAMKEMAVLVRRLNPPAPPPLD